MKPLNFRQTLWPNKENTGLLISGLRVRASMEPHIDRAHERVYSDTRYCQSFSSDTWHWGKKCPTLKIHLTLDTHFPKDIKCKKLFPSGNQDIQPKIHVARHRHSELVTRHLTLHFSLTLTVSIPSRRLTLHEISCRRPTLRPRFMGPICILFSHFF